MAADFNFSQIKYSGKGIHEIISTLETNRLDCINGFCGMTTYCANFLWMETLLHSLNVV